MVVVAALLAGILALQAWQVFGGQSASIQQWQYRIESPDDAELLQRLASLGGEGWEIVFARRATSSTLGESKAAYEMILKRPRSVTDGAVLPRPPK